MGLLCLWMWLRVDCDVAFLFPLHYRQEKGLLRIVDAMKGLCLVNGIVDCTSKSSRVLKGCRLQGV